MPQCIAPAELVMTMPIVLSGEGIRSGQINSQARNSQNNIRIPKVHLLCPHSQDIYMALKKYVGCSQGWTGM